jgi:hypothetical protein
MPKPGDIIENPRIATRLVFLRTGQETGGQLLEMENTLHAESEELLDQHTRYALIVTNEIRDLGGAQVEASEMFQRFPSAASGDYRDTLRDALAAARELGIPQGNIVTASAFTTQSVTAVLEKIRDQIKAATPAPADFHLGPGGARTVFPLSNVTGITWHQQRTAGSTLTDAVLSLATLRVVPGAVGRIAFGKYLSPDYEVHPGEYIPYVPTRTGVPVVQGTNEVYFNLSLPSGHARLVSEWPSASMNVR